MGYEPKCKVCRSGRVDDIEFVRYFWGWPYRIIIDVFGDEMDELNSCNLSTHFNRHTSPETKNSGES